MPGGKPVLLRALVAVCCTWGAGAFCGVGPPWSTVRGLGGRGLGAARCPLPVPPQGRTQGRILCISPGPPSAKTAPIARGAGQIVGGICGDSDPLMANVLLRAAASVRGFDLSQVEAASSGLRVWRSVLVKGRLPVEGDFEREEGSVWPKDPLFSHLSQVLADLQLPRFVLRHPDTVNAVLLTMLQLAINFIEKLQDISSPPDPQDAVSRGSHEVALRQEAGEEGDEQSFNDEKFEALAAELAGEMAAQWGGVIGGVNVLDQLFGVQHGLLDAAGQGGGGDGFGVHDGVWRHSGWRTMPELQRRVASMPELRELMKQLGRRPSAQGASINKFAPQVPAKSDLGVQKDPIARSCVNGLTLSGSLSEMLPSEAVLLRSASPTLRRLFLAKRVEAKLLSYELSGWVDSGSRPRERPRFLPRLPSAPGQSVPLQIIAMPCLLRAIICLVSSFARKRVLGRVLRKSVSWVEFCACLGSSFAPSH